MIPRKDIKLMNILIAVATSIGSKILTAKVIEKIVMTLIEQLVKRTTSEVDDKILQVVKDSMEK